MVQNPRRMGEVGVRSAVAALSGEPVEPHVDTGVALVTADNLDDPEIQALIQ